MAEIQTPTVGPSAAGQDPKPVVVDVNARPAQKKGPSMHEVYALPAPIRTFPLPTFVPSNPVSLLHLAYAWIGQVFRPPPTEPAVVHHGFWSEATNSVHVKDETSMRALWEQGFYGKGSLSRSEPNWLRREQVRRGLEGSHVSEIATLQRRDERAQAKWERARVAQEVIRQTRLEEASLAEARRTAKNNARPVLLVAFLPPVGPAELLALPNSREDLDRRVAAQEILADSSLSGMSDTQSSIADAIINGGAAPSKQSDVGTLALDEPLVTKVIVTDASEFGDSDTTPKTGSSPGSPDDSSGTKTIKRQKSVRFSPTVDSTTFQFSDPPSPNHKAIAVKPNGSATPSGLDKAESLDPLLQVSNVTIAAPKESIVNKEHLQLTPEEACFLSFGFGALRVSDPDSGEALSQEALLTRFRQHSYFPPRIGPDDPDLSSDDGFLVHYAVYHHFRSLGWVPRPGIKFGVDWLLYTRGPVFDHAEFGLVLMPSYSDPWWKSNGKQSPQRDWSWLHSTVRVLAHVMKSLVLVYVDIPPPHKFDEALERGFADALELYQIREVMVKRWSSNRNR